MRSRSLGRNGREVHQTRAVSESLGGSVQEKERKMKTICERKASGAKRRAEGHQRPADDCLRA